MVTIYQPYLIDADDEEWRVEGPLYSEAKLARAFVEGHSAYRYGAKEKVEFNSVCSNSRGIVTATVGPDKCKVGGYTMISTVY